MPRRERRRAHVLPQVFVQITKREPIPEWWPRESDDHPKWMYVSEDGSARMVSWPNPPRQKCYRMTPTRASRLQWQLRGEGYRTRTIKVNRPRPR